MSRMMLTMALGPVSLRFRLRNVVLCLMLVLATLIIGFLVLRTGKLVFSASEIWGALIGAGENPVAERIILTIRLPRLLTAIFVGASLGAAGAIFQSISRNALGSPDIIGFTTGAATGAISQIILFNAGAFAVSLGAALSGMATAAIIFVLTLKNRSISTYRLVLVGIGLGATLTGVNTVLMVMGDLDHAMSAQMWIAGSLMSRTWMHLWPVMLCFALIMPFALYQARAITLLEMGDDIASQFGIKVERTRLFMVIAAVGLTAIATAATGPIAFISLVGPQLAKRLSHSAELPLVSGALMGALLLLSADLLSQNAPFSLNLPIGLTTGLLGSLYLLWILTKNTKI